MRERIKRNILIEEYPILGADGMVKKYGINRRYYIRRASVLGIKFKKRKIKLCVKCNKSINPYFHNKLCKSCSAKKVYNTRGVFSSGNIFSNVEINFLKDNYYDMSKGELCKSLNRSWSSITHKAERMKLKRNIRFIEEGNKKGREWFKNNNPMKNEKYKLKAMKKIGVIFSRNKMTNIEQKVADYLDSLNIPYEFNKVVRMKSSFVFPDFRVGDTLIECDGLYWHKDRINDDIIRDNNLTQMGFNVIRFNDKQILKNFEEVKECINKAILQHK